MGDNIKFIPRKHIKPAAILYLEKYMLEKYYDFLDVKIIKNILICKGSFKPSEYSVEYENKVKFDPSKSPKVYVSRPDIEYNDEIHMYKDDKSLCLYYPSDLSWTSCSHLFDTVIPWTHEWFLFYELYQITGKWQHPFVPHRKIINDEF